MGNINTLVERNILTDALSSIRIDRSLPIVPQIYEQLRCRIVDDRLPPETEISEVNVAQYCNVSRTPLRAAMQQLVADGLIVTRPQVGSFVASLDKARVSEAVFIRSAIEESVVIRLTKKGLDEKLLAPILGAQKAAAELDDYLTFFRFDEEFHALLASMAGVPNSWKLVQSVKVHVDRQRLALTSTIEGRSMAAYNQHQTLLNYIRAKDAKGAVAAMHAHIASVQEKIQTQTSEEEESPTKQFIKK